MLLATQRQSGANQLRSLQIIQDTVEQSCSSIISQRLLIAKNIYVCGLVMEPYIKKKHFTYTCHVWLLTTLR